MFHGQSSTNTRYITMYTVHAVSPKRLVCCSLLGNGQSRAFPLREILPCVASKAK